MGVVNDHELVRLVRGELPAERAGELAREIERDPRLAAEYARLRAAWEGLAEPPFAGVPPGFAARVMARARAAGATPGNLSWAGAPRWAKAAALLALTAGVALGAGLTALARSGEVAAFEEEMSLAERYASALEETVQ